MKIPSDNYDTIHELYINPNNIVAAGRYFNGYTLTMTNGTSYPVDIDTYKKAVEFIEKEADINAFSDITTNETFTDKHTSNTTGIDSANLSLKPCPFCGRKAEIISKQNSQGLVEYSVSCRTYHCIASCIDISYPSKFKAVFEWNTRV